MPVPPDQVADAPTFITVLVGFIAALTAWLGRQRSKGTERDEQEPEAHDVEVAGMFLPSTKALRQEIRQEGDKLHAALERIAVAMEGINGRMEEDRDDRRKAADREADRRLIREELERELRAKGLLRD